MSEAPRVVATELEAAPAPSAADDDA